MDFLRMVVQRDDSDVEVYRCQLMLWGFPVSCSGIVAYGLSSNDIAFTNARWAPERRVLSSVPCKFCL